MPEAGHVVDNCTRMALLGAERAHVRGLVVRLLRRVLHQVLQPQQRRPAGQGLGQQARARPRPLY